MNKRNIPEPAGFTRSRLLLDRLEISTGDIYSCAFHDKEDRNHPACIRAFFERELNRGIWDLEPLQIVDCPGISNLPALHSPIAEKILLSMHANGQHPRAIEELAKVIGLAYGARTWGYDEDDNLLSKSILSEEDYRITCVEDVCEYLTRLDVPEEDRLYFTDKIRAGCLNIDYPPLREQLDYYGCEKWFYDAVRKIDSLMFRSQCLQQALETKRLIYYQVKYPDIYEREYDLLTMDEYELSMLDKDCKEINEGNGSKDNGNEDDGNENDSHKDDGNENDGSRNDDSDDDIAANNDSSGCSMPDYALPPAISDEDIESFLTDLSQQKNSSTLYRENIISQLLSVLISESKPNALLVGPAGCGKTKIVEELAHRIFVKDPSVPKQLHGYKVYSIRISDMVAGSGLMGQLESKIKGLIRYLSDKDRRAILFMDEVHMLFSGETYKKIAQILKPALSRGQIRAIAATTTQEVKAIDADPACNRRFTRVLVDELSGEQTRTVLMACKEKLSRHYHVELDLDESTADLIIHTADEFCLAGSHRPDNALTLLDRSIALAIVNGQTDIVRLDSAHVETTAFRMTSGNSDAKKFDETKFRLDLSRIKGQDHITNSLVKTLRLYDMHIRPRRKPLTFLFAGSSGVGKTEIARIIAGSYICEKPIILNMTEYHSPASINRIIGAPAGYIGSDQNNELPFDALDTNPYQVILLDEFEKCDRAVQRLFMSVFDEGVMKTNRGKEIDFSKAIIIATTNAGCAEKKTLGFHSTGEARKVSISALSDYFDIELLNRFGHIYAFHDISKDIYREIARSVYEREIAALLSRNPGLPINEIFDKQLGEEELRAMTECSYEPKSGARPALAAVMEFIDNRLLAHMDKPGPASCLF